MNVVEYEHIMEDLIGSSCRGVNIIQLFSGGVRTCATYGQVAGYERDRKLAGYKHYKWTLSIIYILEFQGATRPRNPSFCRGQCRPLPFWGPVDPIIHILTCLYRVNTQ